METPITVKNVNLLKALTAHYQAHRAEAIATLDIYFNNSVAVGEKANHLHEMEILVDELARADEGLKTLSKYFKE